MPPCCLRSACLSFQRAREHRLSATCDHAPQGLTPAGVAHSWVLGALVYSAFGFGGYGLVCLYFIAGSAVTKLKLAAKQARRPEGTQLPAALRSPSEGSSPQL